jgi:hypothetical protein
MSIISKPNPDDWQTEPEGLTLSELRSDGWHGQPWPHVFASLGWRTTLARAKGKGGLFKDYLNLATCDHRQIDEWITLYPGCRWEIITGGKTEEETGGVVALDVDRKTNGDGKVITWGLEGLYRAGIIYPSAVTPTATTPRGGIRQLFRHPGVYVNTGELKIDGKTIAGMEVKGDGPAGHCIVAGPGYVWMPHYPPTLALAPCPLWMIMPDDQHHAAPAALPAPVGELSRYCEKALYNACTAILEAQPGGRHAALLHEAFAMGRLVEGFGMPPSIALYELGLAAIGQPRNKPRPSDREIIRTIMDAFTAGERHPRERQTRGR